MRLTGDLGKLEISVLRRSNSETDDYWDGNWLESRIEVDVRGINVLYSANLRVDDFQRFYESLKALKNGTTKESEFTTMEEGLYLHFQVEYNGSVNCKGKANTESGDSLDFKLQTDLGALDRFLGELGVTLKSYPLVGNLE